MVDGAMTVGTSDTFVTSKLVRVNHGSRLDVFADSLLKRNSTNGCGQHGFGSSAALP
jgi:hypothetical protein